VDAPPGLVRFRLALLAGTLMAGVSAVAWAQVQGYYNTENLTGQHLASMDVLTPAACHSACEGLTGCTGFVFGGPIGGSLKLPSAGDLQWPDRPLPAANCSLLTGPLESRPGTNVWSCRMPCTPGSDQSGIVQIPLPEGPIPVPDERLGKLKPGAKGVEPTIIAPDTPILELPIKPDIGGKAKTGVPEGKLGKGRFGGGERPQESGASQTTGEPAGQTTPPQPLTGFEIVRSGTITVAPLSSGTVSASCSPGKIAISVGYLAAPKNSGAADAGRGLEIKSAMPTGASGKVTLRNANVFERATLQAIATCINPVPGLRDVPVVDGVQGPETVSAACNADERVVGGGFEGGMDGHPRGSFPVENGWQVDATKASPLPGRYNFTSRALCAPANAVAGWTVLASPPV
jgi:hypothetical protein